VTIRGHFRQKATQGKTYHLARCATFWGLTRSYGSY